MSQDPEWAADNEVREAHVFPDEITFSEAERRSEAINKLAEFLHNCPTESSIGVMVHDVPLQDVEADWNLSIVDVGKPDAFLNARKSFGNKVDVNLINIQR